jgi:predicted nucleotide-binding protein
VQKSLVFNQSVPTPEDLTAFITLMKASCLESAVARTVTPVEAEVIFSEYGDPVVTVHKGRNGYEHKRASTVAELLEILRDERWTSAKVPLAFRVEAYEEPEDPPIPVDDPALIELWRSMQRQKDVCTATLDLTNADDRYGQHFEIAIESDWDELIEVLGGFWETWHHCLPELDFLAGRDKSQYREFGFPNTRLTSDSIKRLLESIETEMASLVDRVPGGSIASDTHSRSVEVRSDAGFYERLKFDDDAPFFETHDDANMMASMFSITYRVDRLGSDGHPSTVHWAGLLSTWEDGAHVISLSADEAVSLERVVAELQSVASTDAVRVRPRVFIGHGRSQDWKRVDHYLQSLGLETDYFEAKPRAGQEASAIVVGMVETSDFALIVMTAEDEAADVSHVAGAEMVTQSRARQNVVHELGLSQGTLGVSRAIMLVEHGIEIMSNVISIQQLRYQSGRIADTFEELKATILREFPGALDEDARPSLGKSGPRFPWPDRR